jgi:hypothetical protein
MKHITQFSIKRTRESLVHVFAKRELGSTYDTLMQNGNALVFEISNAKRLPENYIDVDVYCKFRDQKQECWYDLTCS